jgi:hypothetical protein
MKKPIMAAVAVVGVVQMLAQPAQAASHVQVERYERYARAECILPWYRFFGACEEAIDDYPYGNHWHDWNNRRHHY